MSQIALNCEQLKLVIEYLNYNGPLFMRISSDFPIDFQNTISTFAISNTL